MEKLITVVVPVYKCEEYISGCIESVINQTYSNFELILVIDGKFDSSVDICKHYAMKDKRIEVIEKENEGVSIARNIGLEKANGEWITFIDSDDYLEKDYLQKLYSKANESDVDIVICDYITEYANRSVNESFLNKKIFEYDMNIKKEFVSSCMIPIGVCNAKGSTNIGVPWSKLYRLSFLKDNNIKFVPYLSRMQDMIFNMYAFTQANKVDYIDLNLYHYRRNEFSSTVGYRADFDKTANKLFYEIDKFNKANNNLISNDIIGAKKMSLINEMIKLQYAHKKCMLSYSDKIRKIKLFTNQKEINSVLKIKDTRVFNKNQKITYKLLKYNMESILYILIKLKCSIDSIVYKV